MMKTPLEETIQQHRNTIGGIFAPKKKHFSLRQELFYHLISAIIIPLVLTTFWGYSFIKKNTEATISYQLSKEIFLVQNIINISLEKAVTPLSISFNSQIEEITNKSLKNAYFGKFQIEIIDTQSNKLITTINNQEEPKKSTFFTENAIAEIAELWQNILKNPQINSKELLKQVPQKLAIKKPTIVNYQVQQQSNFGQTSLPILSFYNQQKKYITTSIPNTNLMIAISINRAEFATIANRLLARYLILIIIIFLIITIIIFLVARRIEQPLQELAIKLQEATLGNLEVRAELIGTTEIITLAHSFNNLIDQVQESHEKQIKILNNAESTRREAESFAEEQQAKNARIQQELLELLGDVEGASGGDLTVRSRISDGEIGIVADFFNSIIESLREIVAQVKEAAEQVNVSVGDNQQTINHLAIEATHQADQITQTLASVEQITQSIQQIAYNAQEAAEVAHIASNKAEKGGESMELTVSSIKQLQQTIDQTAAKVKNLGEASQQISRVISLINQIAMQTNLLSINASIEAARAGEEGKGFAVVAEEVGALATQSSEATKEVGAIIMGIQKEISQVVEAMEIGIIQAEEGTRLVENTKESLQQIVEVSYQIDNLVQAISQTTVSQVETSRNVTQLMEEIAKISEQTSQVSQNAFNSLESTVEIAKTLKSSVGTFKVKQEELIKKEK